MTIGKRIALLSAALLAINAVTGISSLISQKQLMGDTHTLSAQIVPGIYLAGRINTGAKAIVLRIHRYLAATSPDNRKVFEAYLNKREPEWRVEIANYRKLDSTPRQQELLKRIASDMDRTLVVWQRVKELSLAGQSQPAVDLFDKEGVAYSEDLDTAAKDLVAVSKAQSDDIGAVMEKRAESAKTWLYFFLAAALLLGSALAFAILGGIKRALRTTMEEVAAESNNMLGASSMIASASQSLAQGATEQAASLEETSASSTEITSIAARNAESSGAAVALVTQGHERFGEARAALEEMVAAIADIEQSSKKISQIIKTIDGIAFQTNILALNAAVEAARAGESGMGFAVVADEVRNLAQRSAEAARDTAVLIEESMQKSRDGQQKVLHVQQAILAAAAVSDKLVGLVGEVSTGSREQSTGLDQVARAIQQMESITQATAASAEESASAATELNTQSEALNETVSRLAILLDGQDAAQRYNPGRGSTAGAARAPRGSRAVAPHPGRSASVEEFPLD
jgi:methyl-accepting chemotaxis protein/methyl-accepting chemotaxis protein-1 (serine sensor receptor)